MKTVGIKCPFCGGNLEFENGSKPVKCPFCDSQVFLEETENSSVRAGYDFEKGRMKARRDAAKERLEEEKEKVRAQQAADLERIRAQKEADLARIRAAREEENRKKRRVFWIIGWIICFPVPLTVILVRSKMPKILKILIVAAAWAIYIAMIASGMASGEKKPGGNGSEAARPEISHTMHATE